MHVEIAIVTNSLVLHFSLANRRINLIITVCQLNAAFVNKLLPHKAKVTKATLNKQYKRSIIINQPSSAGE